MSLKNSLLQLVESAASNASLAGKQDLASRHAALASLLREFFKTYKGGVEDIEAIEALSAEFSQQCLAFLDAGTAKRQEKLRDGKSASNRHVTNLRSILREAAKRGAIPNLQILPPTPDSNAIELKLKDADTFDDFKKVVAAYEKAAAIIEAPDLASPTDLNIARITERLLGLLLLSILLGGIGLDKLFELSAADIHEGVVALPGTGLKVEVSLSTENLLNRHLPRITDIDPADREVKVAELKRSIDKMLASIGAKRTDWTTNPLACWLQLELESGSQPSTVRQAISTIFNSHTKGKALTAYTPFKLATDISNWYAVKGIGKRNTGDALAKIMAEADATAPEANIKLLPSQMFVPKDILVKIRAGKKKKYNNPLIDKLLFIHCSLADARKAQKKIRDAGVILGFWSDNIKYYTPVPDKQLRDFRRFLDHSEGEFITLDPTVEYKGKRVRIESGQFAGCEGYIIDLKVASSQTADDEKREKYVKCFTVVLDRLQMLGTIEFDSRLVKEI